MVHKKAIVARLTQLIFIAVLSIGYDHSLEVSAHPQKVELSTYIVDSDDDVYEGTFLIDGNCPYMACTLREALAEVNAAGGGIINIDYRIYEITLLPIPAGRYLTIDSNVTINGMGASINGMGYDPIFKMIGSGSVINLLRITHSYGDAILVTGSHNTIQTSIIDNNWGSGIHISGPSSTGGLSNTVIDNLIGILPNDTCSPNENGVLLDDGASLNHIEQNVISCNSMHGILINGNFDDYDGTVIEGNLIGTDQTGNLAKPNQSSGIYNYQGWGTGIYSNLISGNTQNGITLDNARYTAIMFSNLIGTDINGLKALSNQHTGIMLLNGSNGTLIRGDNVISGNWGAGISIVDEGTIHNRISDNNNIGVDISGTKSIPNMGLPIDLKEDGFTPNDDGDTDTGPNNLLNYPEVVSLIGTTIYGTVCENCEVLIYKAFGNPATPGGGGAYLSNAIAAGVDWTASVPSGLRLENLTFVAYDPIAGDTSEMSPRYQIFMPLVIAP